MIQSLINHLFIMTKSPWSDQSQGGASARRSLKPGSPGPSWGHGAVIAANGGDWNHGFLYVSIYLYIYIYWEWKNHPNWRSPWFFRGVGRKTTNQIGAWYFWVSSIGDVFLCVEQVLARQKPRPERDGPGAQRLQDSAFGVCHWDCEASLGATRRSFWGWNYA